MRRRSDPLGDALTFLALGIAVLAVLAMLCAAAAWSWRKALATDRCHRAHLGLSVSDTLRAWGEP